MQKLKPDSLGADPLQLRSALDLCDVFGSYSPGARVELDEICNTNPREF
jgi:hypothetical protein